jgi:leucyl-tRNA---protein transferase
VSAKRYIDDSFLAASVTPEVLDELWSSGWRHQGHLFFRYNHCYMGGHLHDIMPVRIRVQYFQPSKSQRRVMRKNEDLTWEIGPAFFDDAVHDMFSRHSERFADNVPESIYSFFTYSPADTPCQCYSLRCSLGDQLLAVSFMDVGNKSSSSVYAIFDPDHADRSLGTLTMLREIELAKNLGLDLLYPGYGTREPSHYDYKWRFSSMEVLDWDIGSWQLADVKKIRAHLPVTERIRS